MEVAGAGLDHHEDGSAGADAVVRTVVAVERLEFGERVMRRKGAEAATAAAIVQFASVDHVDVVGGAGPVEADAVRRGQRVDAAECGQIVGNSQAERRKGSDIAAVGRELRSPAASDQGADLAGFRLDLQGVRLNGDGCAALPTVRVTSSFSVWAVLTSIFVLENF